MIFANVGKRNSGKESWLPKQVYSSREEVLSRLSEPKQRVYIHNIESLEGGLHPVEQREFMIEVKKVIHPETWFIFSTNSPYIIDELDSNQVRVFHNHKSRFLSQHPDAEWAKETLTTGEFWDAEGEDWI